MTDREQARQEGLDSQPTPPCRVQGAFVSIKASSWQLPKPVVVIEEREFTFPDPTWLKCSQVRRQIASQLFPLNAKPHKPSNSRTKFMWFLPSRNFHS